MRTLVFSSLVALACHRTDTTTAPNNEYLISSVGGYGAKTDANVSPGFRCAKIEHPKNWKCINGGGFTFWSPPGLIDEHTQGIDSEVTDFTLGYMCRLGSDFGMYTATPYRKSQDLNYTSEEIMLGRRRGRLISYSVEPEFGDSNWVSEVYSDDFKGRSDEARFSFGFFVVCYSKEAAATARLIASSVRL